MAEQQGEFPVLQRILCAEMAQCKVGAQSMAVEGREEEGSERQSAQN